MSKSYLISDANLSSILASDSLSEHPLTVVAETKRQFRDQTGLKPEKIYLTPSEQREITESLLRLGGTPVNDGSYLMGLKVVIL